MYYFITTFEKLETKENGWPSLGAIRCWGFFQDLKEAVKTVCLNLTDLNETIYDYAVIEAYEEGICGYEFERWFYKWNNFQKCYDPIPEPEELKHYAGLALG